MPWREDGWVWVLLFTFLLCAGLMEAMMAGLQQAHEIQPTPASLTVNSLVYQPPGTPLFLHL